MDRVSINGTGQKKRLNQSCEASVTRVFPLPSSLNGTSQSLTSVAGSSASEGRARDGTRGRVQSEGEGRRGRAHVG